MSVKKSFCTVFDANYGAMGLSLCQSIRRYYPDCALYVLGWDEAIYKVLTALQATGQWPGLHPVSAQGFYPEIYQHARDTMSYAQRCWLAQPLFCQWVLKNQDVDHVVYMDADCYFFSSPEPLFAELRQAGSVSATMVRHNFSPSLSHMEKDSGRYCVQFNYFQKSPASFKVLDRWIDDCLHYDRRGKGYYPGQLSLDHWHEVSPEAYEIRDPRAGVAPWNLENHDWQSPELPVIFYHFHGLYFPSETQYDLGTYRIPPAVIQRIYAPYLKQVEKTHAELRARFPGGVFVRRATKSDPAWGPLGRLWRRAIDARRVWRRRRRGTYNLLPAQAILQ